AVQQKGSITTSGFTSHTFDNAANTTLTIQTGPGPDDDISLAALLFQNKGTLIVDANRNVELTGNFSALTMTITAGTGNITMPTGGELKATTLTLTSGGTIGATVPSEQP